MYNAAIYTWENVVSDTTVSSRLLVVSAVLLGAASLIMLFILYWGSTTEHSVQGVIYALLTPVVFAYPLLFAAEKYYGDSLTHLKFAALLNIVVLTAATASVLNHLTGLVPALIFSFIVVVIAAVIAAIARYVSAG